MTVFHAAVKSGQVLSRNSQKKEENDFQGSKGLVFVLRFVGSIQIIFAAKADLGEGPRRQGTINYHYP